MKLARTAVFTLSLSLLPCCGCEKRVLAVPQQPADFRNPPANAKVAAQTAAKVQFVTLVPPGRGLASLELLHAPPGAKRGDTQRSSSPRSRSAHSGQNVFVAGGSHAVT